MTHPRYPNILAEFGQAIEELVDGVAGDAYEGWPEYFEGTARASRIERIQAELYAWQLEAITLSQTGERG